MAIERIIDRRNVLKSGAKAGAAALIGGVASATPALSNASRAKKIRVGLIGCGSVSGRYLPDLAQCPYAEVVSLCDIRPERAERRGNEFQVAQRKPQIDKKLARGPFDLLCVSTEMHEQEDLNPQTNGAGKDIWVEKPRR